MVNKYIVLHHITRDVNLAGIKREGLKVGNRPSGYGTKPSKPAIYLYHPRNTQPLYDFIQRQEDFVVLEVRIPVNSDLVNYLTSDEDAEEYTKVTKGDWENSLEKFGTCAVLADIPKTMIVPVFRGDFDRLYKKLPSKLIN